jgi:ribosomal protein L10
VEKARLDFAHVKEEISQLKARKESVLSKLKVLLSSELNLIRALDIDEDGNKKDPSKGTGKEHLEIDEILKRL